MQVFLHIYQQDGTNLQFRTFTQKLSKFCEQNQVSSNLKIFCNDEKVYKKYLADDVLRNCTQTHQQIF